MSTENSKKINFSSEDVRKFASERFGTLKKLADAMGVSQPNLTQSLKGVRPFGALWRERLTDLGFFEWLNPDNKELIKVMGEEWNKLTDDEKKPYVEKAEEDKKRYKREMEAYEKKKK